MKAGRASLESDSLGSTVSPSAGFSVTPALMKKAERSQGICSPVSSIAPETSFTRGGPFESGNVIPHRWSRPTRAGGL
jgi:hypothetical protein